MNLNLVIFFLAFFLNDFLYGMDGIASHHSERIADDIAFANRPPVHPETLPLGEAFQFVQQVSKVSMMASLTKMNERLQSPLYVEYLEVVSKKDKELPDYQLYESVAREIVKDFKKAFYVAWSSKYPTHQAPDIENALRVVDPKIFQSDSYCRAFITYKMNTSDRSTKTRSKNLEEYKGQFALHQHYMAVVFFTTVSLSK